MQTKSITQSKKMQNKGITLIALVITIIILLILAAISINALTESGLFGKAKQAKIETGRQEAKEQVQLAVLASYGEDGKLDYGQLKENLSKISGITDLPDSIENLPITVNVNGYEVTIQEDGTVTVAGEKTDTGSEEEKPTGPEAIIVEPNNKTALENARASKPENSNLIVEDETKGIVMRDSKENEWTWVEVPGTIFTTAKGPYQYNKIKTDLIQYVTAPTNYRVSSYDDLYHEGCGVEAKEGKTAEEVYNEMYNKMLSSVYTNGGFWISKYEIGDSTATTNNTARTSSSGIAGVAVSKIDQIPYTYVTNAQAQTLASEMSTDSNQTSSLLFGLQWDLVCKYIDQKKGISLNTTYVNHVGSQLNRGKYNPREESDWISYSVDSDYVESKEIVKYYVLLTTGASEMYNMMNIYDILGNVDEFTLESNNGYFVYRGNGSGRNFGSQACAYRRSSFSYYGDKTEIVGFRATLY